jgi:hypothetical protein
VHVVGFAVEHGQRSVHLGAHGAHRVFAEGDAVSGAAMVLGCHTSALPSVVMQMRYRYRIEPTPAQQQMLARVFGCCRVVFNDALRVRDETYRAGVKLSDSEIQRRVITAAKTTEARAWLCEVPSVALVQSVNDSRRAWRNFFDSAAGKRRGRRIGRPRFKSRKITGNPFGSPATDSTFATMDGCS